MSAAPIQRATAEGGYRKGEEARGRILAAALKVFGAGGFRGATTRQIAEEAGVNLPALKYYFGGKEGLYLACAEEILARYQSRMQAIAEDVLSGLAPKADPAAARAALKRLLSALAELLVGGEEPEVWTAFMLREMAERGPAFDFLFDRLWAPGVAAAAELVARALGRDQATEPDRIQALFLISSLSAFSTARSVAVRTLGWPDTRGDRFSAVLAGLAAQVDRLRPELA